MLFHLFQFIIAVVLFLIALTEVFVHLMNGNITTFPGKLFAAFFVLLTALLLRVSIKELRKSLDDML